MVRHACKLLILPVSVALAGCGGSSDGRLKLSVTDAPVDYATSVVVEITGVELQPDTGIPIVYTFAQPQQVDLLQLQNGISTPLFQGLQIPAGHYQWLQLEVSASSGTMNSYIVLNDGSQHALVMPAAAQAGLRTASGFTITANSGSALTLEFDARKSVIAPLPGSTDYQLEPVLRLVDNSGVGNIIGFVAGTLITSGCTPTVYVYTGNVSSPADLNNTAPASSQPLTESAVTLDNSTGNYDFTAAFLPPGTYTLAFTCDAAADNPAAADTISFSPVITAPVVAAQTVLVTLK
ncbi:MAG: DUF4382 domain-containing protein [Gammaproteobacteria bacterium]|nr:DUF4382 domain-containing protein [Gammaproteobacteria bacterium]